ncbi:MAG: hypothetical protein AAF471_06850, partial [Myxococcota bacterium]
PTLFRRHADRWYGPNGLRFAGVGSARLVNPRGGVAPTGRSTLRGRAVRGEVNDDNAFVLGGAAGHAGLFGGLSDVEQAAAALLRVLANRSGPPDEKGVGRTLRRFAHVRRCGRPLGFDAVSESVFSEDTLWGKTRRKSPEKAEFIGITESRIPSGLRLRSAESGGDSAGQTGLDRVEGNFQRGWSKLGVPAKYRGNEDTLWGEKCNNVKTRSGEGSTAGWLSRATVGHLGFTGTSLWLDPVGRGTGGLPAYYVVLSNAVQQGYHAGRMRWMRRRVHWALSLWARSRSLLNPLSDHPCNP